jgi:hypothetical protein
MSGFRLLLRRWLRLPSPVDLGWSDTDALGMRQFTPYQEGKTWEDWTDYVRAHHPVRYFLAEILPLWVQRRFIWPVERFCSLVLDHVLSSRRYHLLDLRGVDSLSHYRHGYLDPSEVFRLAGWASLMRWYRESGRDKDQRHWGLELDSQQLKQYCEALELVNYWSVIRVERETRCDQLYAAVAAIPTTPENQQRYEAARDIWLQHFRESEDLEEAMWLRLAALRSFLWV